jgi:hypothetical protein
VGWALALDYFAEVQRWAGFSSLTDERGTKTAAVIDLKVHKALWEDIEDVLVSRSRSREKGVPLAKVKAALIAKGKLRG